ncbi:MAG: ABC transporter permease [Clostridiales Family XIII bacterium]|jgi:simple sugar transport system permease protein|nr:ABC transporter permease [Clostridiales Family XIII bacterium]
MEAFLAAAIVAAMPLLFATLGELLTEKSGSLNLGVEGMMLIGAVIGFITAYGTGSPGAALLGAFGAGAAGALIFAVVTVTLRGNQVVTGLTLTIFGSGFASFVGDPLIGKSVPKTVQAFFAPAPVPGLSEVPFIGPVFFRQDAFVYLGYALVVLISIYLYKTRPGLNMRAIGESTAAADASGVAIDFHKYAHILFGGGLCGLGGAYLALVYVPMWQADVVTGRGWIAVALVIFASWNPAKAFAGSFLFGALSILGFRLQSMGFHISQYLVDMFPYIATIAIVIISTHKNRKEDLPPADLSVPYFREER